MIADRFREQGVIPVVTIDNPAAAEPLGKALRAGGLPCVEITLRTDAALEGIRRLAAVPEMLVGAGTVLSIEQAEQALAAGAAFLVAPGLNPGVVRWALEQQVPIFPGISSATEIEAALNLGLKQLKFFPAEPLGGLSLIQALSKPYHMVSFLPTGGIGPGNLAQYLSDPCIFACGGSWMVKNEWIRAGDFNRVRDEAGKTVQLVHSIRRGQ